jgi:hypothetical protein
MGAAASVYKDELYGDATQTIALCTCYDQLVAMQQSKISLMKYKKEPISDKRFREHLILPANDPHFNSFNAYVNDACQKARWTGTMLVVVVLSRVFFISCLLT